MTVTAMCGPVVWLAVARASSARATARTPSRLFKQLAHSPVAHESRLTDVSCFAPFASNFAHSGLVRESRQSIQSLVIAQWFSFSFGERVSPLASTPSSVARREEQSRAAAATRQRARRQSLSASCPDSTSHQLPPLPLHLQRTDTCTRQPTAEPSLHRHRHRHLHHKSDDRAGAAGRRLVRVQRASRRVCCARAEPRQQPLEPQQLSIS